MYVNHWAQMMYGSFFNYWFIECGQPNSPGVKADANKAGYEGRALMPSIWSERLHPQLQPELRVALALDVKVFLLTPPYIFHWRFYI
jgi:hypothetical protein